MEDKKTKNKMMIIDWVIAGVALVILAVCFFLRGCKFDVPCIILAAVLVAAGAGLLAKQNKMLKDKE